MARQSRNLGFFQTSQAQREPDAGVPAHAKPARQRCSQTPSAGSHAIATARPSRLVTEASWLPCICTCMRAGARLAELPAFSRLPDKLEPSLSSSDACTRRSREQCSQTSATVPIERQVQEVPTGTSKLAASGCESIVARGAAVTSAPRGQYDTAIPFECECRAHRDRSFHMSRRASRISRRWPDLARGARCEMRDMTVVVVVVCQSE